jgi:plastocyanin
MRRQVFISLGLAGPLLLGLGACGDDGEPARHLQEESDGGTAADLDIDGELVVVPGDQVEVRAQDNEFVEPHIQVESGATVVWSNVGRQDHDLLPVEGDDWGVDVEDFTPGEAYERTFDEPGVYPYYCSLHGTENVGMIGTVVVE